MISARAADAFERLAARRVAVWSVLAVGMGARLHEYLVDRSLWFDEAMLAVNIVRRSFSGLLQPLEYHQAAPVGFLLVERLAVTALGPSEYALRLFPLFCGITALVVFWRLADRILAPVGAFVATALFAVSGWLIYYSAEVKQYSGDVLFCLLLWWLVARRTTPRDVAQGSVWPLAIVGAIAIWFSHPSVFVLTAIGLGWFWRRWSGKYWTKWSVDAVVCGFWLLNFAGAYLISLRSVAESEYLRGFWGTAAMPFPPLSYEQVRWYSGAIATLAALPAGNAVSELVAVAAIVGGVALYGHRTEYLHWLVGPALLALAASALQKYPLIMRLWLFWAPALLLLAAVGVEQIWERNRKSFPLLALTAVVLLLLHPTLSTVERVFRPTKVEELRTVLQRLQAERQEGDAVYVSYGAVPGARYYGMRGLLQPETYVQGIRTAGNVWALVEDVEKLRGRQRVWLVIAHVYPDPTINEEEFLVRYLDRTTVRHASYKTKGASLYLYDFRQ